MGSLIEFIGDVLHVLGLVLLYGLMAVAVVVGIITGIARANEPPPPKRKRYVMRGYGGGKNATSLHPRQAAAGKRIVYIPGVGYRHVAAKPRPGKDG